MKQTYIIVGIHNEDGFKRLELRSLESYTEDNKEIGPGGLLNLSKMVKDVSKMYQKNLKVDVIRIPDDVFRSMKLVIDGEFMICYGE